MFGKDMTQPPERIGICRARLGDNDHYISTVVIIQDSDNAPVCEHCGSQLLVYVREKGS